MNRFASLLLVVAGASALGACDLDLDLFGNTCINIDGCSSGQSGYDIYIVGFPYDRVDRSTTTPDGAYQGRVAVGDTFTLQLVRKRGTSLTPVDTIRVDRWEVTDSAVAGISSRPWGAGFFTAKAPGAVAVVADWRYTQLWACQGQGCSRVGQIVVTPH